MQIIKQTGGLLERQTHILTEIQTGSEADKLRTHEYIVRQKGRLLDIYRNAALPEITEDRRNKETNTEKRNGKLIDTQIAGQKDRHTGTSDGQSDRLRDWRRDRRAHGRLKSCNIYCEFMLLLFK